MLGARDWRRIAFPKTAKKWEEERFIFIFQAGSRACGTSADQATGVQKQGAFSGEGTGPATGTTTRGGAAAAKGGGAGA